MDCIQYGMILLEDHECDREGWRGYERDEGHGDQDADETEI